MDGQVLQCSYKKYGKIDVLRLALNSYMLNDVRKKSVEVQTKAKVKCESHGPLADI